MRRSLFCLFFALSASLACANTVPDQPERILVNNRILAKVEGKAISVLDVKKRMDVVISRHLPHLTNSPPGRYQFYSSQWKETLFQLIDEQLILADAEKIELKTSDGDVREKLQERFGPNVVKTLESLGITYEEAREMIRNELIVQKMTWYRINSKAILSINPKDVKSAFKEYCSTNPPKDEWKYQSLTIRSSDPKINEELSEKAFALLEQGKAGLAAIAEELKQSEGTPGDLSVTVSQEYAVQQKDLSDSHKAALLPLEPGTYSKPIAQPSRVNNQIVHRIFHLKERVQEVGPSFNDLSEKIEDRLVQEAMSKEASVYISKLRSRFNYDEKQMMEMIPSDFQPFALPHALQTH